MIKRVALCLLFLGLLSKTAAYANPFVVDSTGTETKNGKTYVLHSIESGQTWYAVMRKYKVNISELRAANPGMKDNLAVGQVVRVPSQNRPAVAKTLPKEPEKKPENSKLVLEYEVQPKTTSSGKNEEEKAKADVSKVEEKPTVAANTNKTTTTEKTEAQTDISLLKNSLHVVEGGQTLYGIAIKHGVLMADIRRWNGLTSDQLRSGQELIVSEQTYQDYLKKNKLDSVRLVDARKTTPDKIIPPPRPEDPTNGDLPESKIINTGKRILETGVAEVLGETDSNNKYLALHRTAPVGSLIQVKNVSNNQSVWVKVIGKLPDISANNRIIIKLSARAQEKLSPGGRQFIAEISYLSQ